jgi:hypothetical protein
VREDVENIVFRDHFLVTQYLKDLCLKGKIFEEYNVGIEYENIVELKYNLFSDEKNTFIKTVSVSNNTEEIKEIKDFAITILWKEFEEKFIKKMRI